MKKTITAIFLAAAVAAGGFGCRSAGTAASGQASQGAADSSAAAAKGEIKIGAVFPLTGSVAAYGQSAQKGLELLEEQVNKDGGINGSKLTFLYADDEGKPATSVTVGQKLINNDKVVAITGPLTSNCALSLAPVCQQYKIPLVSGSATNEKVTLVGDYIFRTCFIDPFQGEVIAKLASADLKAQNAAVLYDNGNDYSKGLAENFQSSFEKYGGKVVASETYLTGDKDFNAQLTQIAAQNPDVLYLPDYYSIVAVIAAQARGAGIKATFLGGDGWGAPELFKIGGDAVNGAYYSNHYSPDDTSPEVVQFIEQFKAKFNGEVPDAMSVLCYDAAKVLVQSIGKAGSTDGEAIKNALKEYDGTVVSGHIKFNETRDAVKPAVIIKTKDGKETFYSKIEP